MPTSNRCRQFDGVRKGVALARRRTTRRLAAGFVVVSLAGGCHDAHKYGIGTPCDESSPCREPLECHFGSCALKEAGQSGSGDGAAGSLQNAGGTTGSTSRGGASSGKSSSSGSSGAEAGRESAGATSSKDSVSGGTFQNQTSEGGASAGVFGTGGSIGGSLSTGGAAGTMGEGGVTAAGSAGEPPMTAGGVAGTTVVATAGSGPRVLDNGAKCSLDSDCLSTHCIDGVCCETTCSEQCKACNVEGDLGRCTLVTSGQPVGARTPCKNAGTVCGGTCDGQTSCSYPGAKKICDPTSGCSTQRTRVDGTACNGMGYCSTAVTTDCFPQFCNINTDGKCGPLSYTQVDVTEQHSCAVVSDGSARCWGSNVVWGELGLPEKKIYDKPTGLEFLTNVKSIAAGWAHNCVLLHDGRVRCWGANVNGDLGCPFPTAEATNTCFPFPIDSGVASLVAGAEQTCTVMNNGTILCWGRGDHGQIGDGYYKHRFSPTAVLGIDNAVSAGLGIWHGCAVLSDGAVKCWGDNNKGCIGIGRIGGLFPEPTLVTGIDGKVGSAKAVAASVENTCFLMSDSSIRCAGANNHGQLGDGKYADSPVPVAAHPPLTASAIALGTYFACAVVSPQSVKCWGRGAYGVLGNGDSVDSLAPVAVTLPSGVNVVSIAARYNHACVVDSFGRIWCWGDNTHGQLGNGTRTTSSVPVEVGAP